MKRLANFILTYATPLLFTGLLIAVIGAATFFSMPRGIFPEVDFPRVLVEINAGFAPLEVLEWSTTSVIERELRTVPGVRVVRSTTSRGTASINVFLNEGEDVNLALNRVNAKLAEVRAALPPNAQLRVRPITAAAFTGAEYCFVSEQKNELELRRFVEYTIKPRVMVIPGVFNALTIGGDMPELRVELDPQKLATHNLTLADIDDRIKNSNIMDFIGPFHYGDQEILGFAGRLVQNARDLENLVIHSSTGAPIHLSALGKITSTAAWKFKDLSLNGKPCVALDIFYQQGVNQSITSTNIRKTVQEILDADGKISMRYWDLNEFTERASGAVILDLFIGMAIIALITYLFLRDWRFSLIALLSMPFSACLTFLVMKHHGMTLNLMTLGGLTAAIGLVVDNTVIILEMFHRLREEHPELNKRAILQKVLLRIGKPMVWGTVAIALVFTPIGLLSGLAGQFFEPMAKVHGISLALSLITAIFLIPGLLQFIRQRSTHTPHSPAAVAQGRYSTLIAKIMRQRYRYLAIALAIPLAALVVLPFSKSGFLPVWDEGDMVIDYRAKTSLGLAATVARIKPLEEKLKAIPEIDFFVRKTGTSLGTLNKAPYMGEIVVKLREQRKKSVFALMAEIEKIAEEVAPDFEYDFFQILPDRLNDLTGTNKPITLYLRGKDRDELDRAAAHYFSLLKNLPGLDSVRIEEPPRANELGFIIDQNAARAFELNPSTVIQNVRADAFSVDSSTVQSGNEIIPLRLQFKRNKVLAATDITSRPMSTFRGGLTRLGNLGKITIEARRVESTHLDGITVASITAQLDSKFDLSTTIARIRKVLAENSVAGIDVELAGDYAVQQQSFSELLRAFALGIFIILITSLFCLNDLQLAVWVTLIALLPPAVGILGLFTIRVPLDVSAFSGLISVTGVAVANMYMALHSIHDLGKNNTNPIELIVEGMQSRVRPILMTNLAAMAGFIPIAVGIASGDEMLKPFSIAIICGLLGSMLATLFVLPLVLGVSNITAPKSPLPTARRR